MSDKKIKQAVDRQRAAVTKRPGSALGRSSLKASLVEGLKCKIEEGPWSAFVDQPTSVGGRDEAPNPGFYGRGSIAACLVQGYAIALAERGIEVTKIEVEISGEVDARGFLGVGEVSPHYNFMQAKVILVADGSEEVIRAALDYADSHSPWLGNLIAAIPFTREMDLTKP